MMAGICVYHKSVVPGGSNLSLDNTLMVHCVNFSSALSSLIYFVSNLRKLPYHLLLKTRILPGSVFAEIYVHVIFKNGQKT